MERSYMQGTSSEQIRRELTQFKLSSRHMAFDATPERIKKITGLPASSWVATIGAEMKIFAKRMVGTFDYIYVIESNEETNPGQELSLVIWSHAA